MKTLFLTGYEGETLKDFLEKLEKNKVTSVIDVREVPLSRKNGFSKDSLERVLTSKKIKYDHIPELGSPSHMRKSLHETGDYLSFFEAYRKYIKTEKNKIADVERIVSKEKNPVLLCFEKITDLCHRTILASEILKDRPNLKITQI